MKKNVDIDSKKKSETKSDTEIIVYFVNALKQNKKAQKKAKQQVAFFFGLVRKK